MCGLVVEGFFSRIYLNDFICEKITGIKHSTILDAIVHLDHISENKKTWDCDLIDTWHKIQREEHELIRKNKQKIKRGSEIAKKSRASSLMSDSVADLMRVMHIEHHTEHHTTLDDGASPLGVELQDLEKGNKDGGKAKDEAKKEESKNKVINDSSVLLNLIEPKVSAQIEVAEDELKAKRMQTIDSLHSVTSEDLRDLKSCCTNRKRQGKFVKKICYY